MKRKKVTRKTRSLALAVAVALGCSVSAGGIALAEEPAATAEAFVLSIGDREPADNSRPVFQTQDFLPAASALSSTDNSFVVIGKDSADSTIDIYTGTTGVYVYTHAAADPTAFYGGNLTIVAAEKDANNQKALVRLRTDSSGIDLTNAEKVQEVLHALAQKLTYRNYVKANGNERNLSGYAEIAEGLTQGSFVMKQGTIAFESATGRGKSTNFNSFNKFTTALTGNEATDADYKEYIQQDPAATDPYRQVTYNFRGSTTIRPDVTSTVAGGNFAAIMPAEGKQFYVTTGNASNQSLLLDLTGIKTNGGKVYGIYNDQAAGVKVYAYGGMSILGPADGTYAGGIFAGNANGQGTSTVEIAEVYYNNFLTINGTGTDFAGIKAIQNGVINSNAFINIVTDGGYGVVAENGGVVNLNQTDKKSIINTNGNVALYAKDGGKITFRGAKEINGDAVAEGEGSSIDLVLGGYGGDGSETWNGNAIGHVNVAFQNNVAGHTWQGTFDSDGTLSLTTTDWEGSAKRDGASILLLGKANWTGTLEKGGNLTLMGRSNWSNTKDKATTVNNFTGPNVDGLRGSITSAADLAIDKFSGMAAVYFTHGTDDPATIQGGRVTIKSADKEAAITLRTDNSGIDLANDTVVNSVLNSLAQKLTYSAYVTGENNLAAYAEIAEGLTAGALARKIGTIRFDKTTGAGSVTDTGLTPFNAVITGDSVKDKAFADRGVLAIAGNTSTYTFTADAVINNSINIEGATPDPANMQYAIAINPDDNKAVVLNMNGHDLTIRNNIGQGQMAQSTSAVIYALNSDTSVTINNPGAIDLSTFSSAYYAGGIAAGNRYPKDDKACEVIINNDNTWDQAVKIRGVMGMGGVDSGSIFNVNWTGIKVFNHGHVDIKGLVDIESFGAWSVNALGNDGYINIGGGRIVSRDYASISAYADGTVNVNVNGSGDSLQAGSNDVKIEGNLKATGQWVGAGSGGHLNVALVNQDSYLAGLADNPAGGTINLFLQNGATWTNQDGGFRYGGTSTFNDAAQSLVTHFTGGDSETSRGLIVQKQTGKITLANYQGQALAYYEHDEVDPTKIIGGDLEITAAVKTGNDNAVITLRTDSSGIKPEDKDLVTKVLDNLAAKLSYTNYITGERNLTGFAEIAEGLTASKLVRQEPIIFDGHSGVGQVSPAPLGQTATKFTTSLTGDPAVDEQFRKAGAVINGKYVLEKATVIELGGQSAQGGYYQAAGIQTYTPLYGNQGIYKDVVVEAKNGLKIDGTNAANSAGIYSGNGSNLTIDGHISIDMINKYSYGQAIGIAQDFTNWEPGAQATMTINGNVAMDIKHQPADGTGPVQRATPRSENVTGILNRESNSSIITINGLLDLAINGNGVITDCRTDAGGVINLKGGRIDTNENKDINNHALLAYSGTINLNMNPAQTIAPLAAKTLAATAALTPGNTKVEVEGNILAIKNAATTAASKNLLDGTVNLALTTGESYWQGVADNAGADKLGTFNLFLQNGALWIHDSQGLTYDTTAFEYTQAELQGTFDGISHVTGFHGGDSAANRGIIQQKSASGIAIEDYSGSTMVIYGHSSLEPADIVGGGISIKKAAAGSEITVMTDSSGIDVAEEETVTSVLNALAGKLTYSGYTKANGAERNLAGKVAIGEGLTAPGILWKVGDIAFAEADGQGSLADGTVITPENPIEYGQYETMIMSGTKSAMVSSALLWRAENNDMQKRLGELRLAPDAGGIWASVYAGKNKYDQGNTRYSTSYKAVQLGYDKETDNGWRLGAAVSHNDGESDYILGGKGDNTATSLSLYGSWLGGKGHYTDIVVKGGQVKNDFTVYNEMGHKVAGDYKTNGLSVSAEYGRRLEHGNGLYVEPQLQLSWGRLQGKDYTATSDVKDGDGNYRTMNISQDGFTSLVGRIGVGVGHLTATTSIYAKAFLAHEFSGDFSSRFTAEEAKSSRVDLGGSWAVFQLGGSAKVSDNSYAYANLEKSTGSDIDTDWRVDAGLRWSF